MRKMIPVEDVWVCRVGSVSEYQEKVSRALEGFPRVRGPVRVVTRMGQLFPGSPSAPTMREALGLR